MPRSVNSVGPLQDDAHPRLPSGVVTFLFTDIEGSSLRWEQRPDEMKVALRRHDEILYDVVESAGGVVIRHTGDGLNCVFRSSVDAVAAAIEGQRRLQTDDWCGVDRVLVRMGLNCGDIAPSGEDYYGPPINRAARVMDVANGDQIAISGQVAEMVGNRWPLTEIGEVRLKGIGTLPIMFVEADGLRHDPRPPRVEPVLAGSRLPAHSDKLVGRAADVDELSGLLDRRRLVSVVGLGGLGKTRLACEVARSIETRFAHGAVYCDLTEVTTGADVVEAVAHSLGAREQPAMDLLDSVADFVEHRDVLLVVDNCEHVLDEVRQVLDRVLSVDGPAVLATSREPLAIVGEQLYAIEPLVSASDAVELFVTRALERDAHFGAEADDLEVIARICERLDGIPLAIELAAARVRVLEPTQLLERLDDRFRVLRDSRRAGSLPALEATVAWSYEQLAPDEQHFFDQLSVFPGGISLQAAATMYRDGEGAAVDVDDVLDLLMVLVDKSLVSSARGVGEIRFTVLETLRAYGAARLAERGETAAAARRHGRFFAELARDLGADLLSAREADIWRKLELEWSNLRGAVNALVEIGSLDPAAEAVVAIGWYASFAMRMEAFAWAADVLAADTDETVERRAELFALRAMGAYLTADDRVHEFAATSLRLDPADLTALARTALAGVALNNTYDIAASDEVTAAMLEHGSVERPMPYLAGVALRTFHLCLRNPSPDAIVEAARAVEIAQATESASAMGVGQWAWGLAHIGIDWSVPVPAFESGLDYTGSLSSHHLMGHLINGLVVHFLAVAGEIDEAVVRSRDAIRAAMDVHYLVGTSHLLGAASVTLARAGRPDVGARLIGAMIANGHPPRRDVRDALAVHVGADLDRLAEAGAGLSIVAAGAVAVAALDELATD